jgi:nucleoid DNA-binding protein
MRKSLFGLAALVVVLTVTAEAQNVNQKKDKAKEKVAPDLKAGLVRETNLKEATVEKVLKAMAPAMKEQLKAGRSVTIEGVGTFQVVRIDAYQDINRNGEPITIPARNYVEFVPTDGLNEAANSADAVPARTVKGYKFEVNPNANPGLKNDGMRVPRTRVR